MESLRSTALRTGSRIRDRRLDLGVRQADLAAQAGISASYLNLIEHDKRRIGGALLSRIAAALHVPVGVLTEGASRQLIAALRQAASDIPDSGAETGRAEEMAARYPGWAALLGEQAKRIAALERRVQLLQDRIKYDPDLATALHGVISAVTSIRATAGILTSDETLDADWQRRFQQNIHADAVRLAADSEALVGYLDPPVDAAAVPLSPLEEVEAYLGRSGWHSPALENGASAEAWAAEARLRASATGLLVTYAQRYAQDAAALPLAPLLEAISACGDAPLAIAARTGVALPVVLRRLAALPAGQRPVGLVICDAGGFPQLFKGVPGFTFPRGTACPLWPVFTALGQPGRPVVETVAMPGQEGVAGCVAVSEQRVLPGLPPLLESFMVVLTDVQQGPAAAPPVQLGVSCRICPREACPARREPSALRH